MLVSLECLYNNCTSCFSTACSAHVQGTRQMHDGLQACCRYQQNTVYICNCPIHQSYQLISWLTSTVLHCQWYDEPFLSSEWWTLWCTHQNHKSQLLSSSQLEYREKPAPTQRVLIMTLILYSHRNIQYIAQRIHTSVEAGRCLHLRFRESMGLLLVLQLSSVDSNSFQCCQPTWGATTGLRTT